LCATASLVTYPTIAEAQIAEEASDGSGGIVVTARKREESLVEIPISLQAFTAKDIEHSGVTDLQELSRFTPSLNFVNGTQGQGGRVVSEVRFRGLATPIAATSNQTGSVFVDGIFVLGGAQSIGFEDVERIEVIKGPQAAYFGRSTFGGAVNFITREPKDRLGGSFSATYSPSFGSYALSGSIEGPLIGDTVLGRISASAREQGGQFNTTDGGRLGREHTDAVHATLLIKPAPGLKIKLRGSYSEDSDGPPAGAYVSYDRIGNCPAGTPVTVQTTEGPFNGALARRNNCGTLAYDRSLVNSNTGLITIPADGNLRAINLYDIFVNNTPNDPILAQAPYLDHMGMFRWMVRLSGAVDYDISDQLSLAVSAGYNKQKSNTIRDTDGSVRPAGFQAVPMTFVDKSAEARLRYDNKSWLNASIGVNYFRQDILADIDNGLTVVPVSQSGTTITRRIASSVNNENDKITTKGIFGGVDITPIDWATLTLEGRYQIDTYTRFGGNNADGTLVAIPLKTKSFTPRVILTARPMEAATLYATYSVGVLPGSINSGFQALMPAQRAAVIAVAPDTLEVIPSQKLINYEIGYKQYFRDLRLQVSIAAFQMDWKNMPATNSIIVAALPNPVFSVTTAGRSRIRGIEFDGNWQVTDNLNLAATAGYLDPKYVDFAARGSNALVGLPTTGLGSGRTYKTDGNYLPRNPRVTATGTVTWTDDFVDDWTYRIRADVLYTGMQYMGPDNLASIPSYTMFNLAVGLENGPYAINVFAKNLFNKQGWQRGLSFIDISNVPTNLTNTGNGSFLTPIELREVGATISYRF
jgi:iron complex outermembrane receptor protein